MKDAPQLNIPKIVWDDETYSVGNEELDKQHYKIVTMINELLSFANLDSHSELLHDLLHNMLEYSNDHLAFEEKLLKYIDYEDFDNHEAERQEYVEAMAELSLAVIQGKDEVSFDVLSFLVNWWNNHILIEDMKYKKYMK